MNDNGEVYGSEKARATAAADLSVLLGEHKPLLKLAMTSRERMELALRAAAKRHETIRFLAAEAQQHAQRCKAALNRARSEMGLRKAIAKELREARCAAILAQKENEELREKIHRLETLIAGINVARVQTGVAR